MKRWLTAVTTVLAGIWLVDPAGGASLKGSKSPIS
jgi:hypothetical protein